MVSTKWCLMHRSGSESPRCGCVLSLALLLLADWTKPSRGQHIRTSSRPEGGPTEMKGFMIGATLRLSILTGCPPRHTVSVIVCVSFCFTLSIFFSHFCQYLTQVVFQGLTKECVFVSLLFLLVQRRFKVSVL
ncbi:uncharacterized [Lates japonicus]